MRRARLACCRGSGDGTVGKRPQPQRSPLLYTLVLVQLCRLGLGSGAASRCLSHDPIGCLLGHDSSGSLAKHEAVFVAEGFEKIRDLEGILLHDADLREIGVAAMRDRKLLLQLLEQLRLPPVAANADAAADATAADGGAGQGGRADAGDGQWAAEEARLGAMPAKELKQMLRALDLETAGKKSTLVARLLENGGKASPAGGAGIGVGGVAAVGRTPEGHRYHTGGGQVGYLSKATLPVSRQWLRAHTGREVDPPAAAEDGEAVAARPRRGRKARSKAAAGGQAGGYAEFELETLSVRPLVLLVRDFLSPAETEHIRAAGSALMKPSSYHGDQAQHKAWAVARTSSSSWLPPMFGRWPASYNAGRNDSVLQAVIDRATAALMLPDSSLSEGFQVVHYKPGQVRPQPHGPTPW